MIRYLFAVILGLFLAAPCFGEGTLAITSQANDLDDFLAKPLLVTKYFEHLQEQYGKDRFTREAFDNILGQLIYMKDRVPGLKQRLWETGIGQEFSIETVPQSYGRQVDAEKWTAFLTSLTKEVGTLASPYKDKDPKQAEREAIEVLGRYAERSAGIKKRIKGQTLTEAEETEVRKEFAEIKNSAEMRSALAFFLDRKLATDKVHDALLSGDANMILDTMSVLRKNPTRFLPPSVKEIGPLMRGLLPEINGLLADKELFAEIAPGTKISKVTYQFKPVARVLDGIWKGISIGECVGGSCYGENKQALTPERWLSSALEGTALYEVFEVTEASTRNRGFVQLLPMKNHKTGEVYASVDFGSTALADRILVSDPDTGARSTSTLLQAWLEHAPEYLPENLRQMVVGESRAINNAGLLDTIHGSMGYLMGKTAGHSDDFYPIGPLAPHIVAQSPRRVGNGAKYSGRMVADGLVPDAGVLRVLKTEAKAIADIGDLEVVRAIIEGTDTPLKGRVMDALIRHPKKEWEAIPEMKETFRKVREHHLLEKERDILEQIVQVKHSDPTGSYLRNPRRGQVLKANMTSIAVTLGLGYIAFHPRPGDPGMFMPLFTFAAAIQSVLAAFSWPKIFGPPNETYLHHSITQQVRALQRDLTIVRAQIRANGSRSYLGECFVRFANLIPK